MLWGRTTSARQDPRTDPVAKSHKCQDWCWNWRLSELTPMQNTMFLRSKLKERRARATLSVAGVDVRTKIPAILGFQVLAVVLMKRQVGFSLIYGYFKILHKQYFYCMHDRHKAGGEGGGCPGCWIFSKLLLVHLHETAKPISLLLSWPCDRNIPEVIVRGYNWEKYNSAQ